MAIVKFATPIAGLRGTIGGVVYSANGAGPYVKPWGMPPNPRTSRQQIEREFLSRLSQEWRDLSGAEQAAWDTFAALAAQDLTNSLGETYSASGFNWFCKCNVRLLRVGLSTIQATPTQARPSAPTILDFRVTTPGSDPDLCTGGTPSASTFEPGFPASKAFDDSIASADEWRTLAGNPTGWIEYDFGSAVQILKYRIYPSSSGGTPNPKDWDLEYWDGGAWQIADSITSMVFVPQQWFSFFSPTRISAQRWRINITANNGSASLVRIREIEMMAATNDASVAIYTEDNFAAAPDYDVVLHVAQGQTIGRRVWYPNFREVIASQSPGRWYVEFQDELEALVGQIQLQRSWFGRLFRQTTEGIRSAAAAARAETL